jgi:type IV pilus modification protein PilV
MWRSHFSKNKKQRIKFPQKDPQQGFSLVEVLVAILLLTVGLLALAKMQTYAVASNSFGNQLTQATFLAQDKLEELRLLNECYLEVLAKPEISWTTADQDIVDNYNSQLSDVDEDNWKEEDTDGDTIKDRFRWEGSEDHTNSDGPGTVANPININGDTVSTGGYTRTWYVVNDRPTIKAKIVQVRVTWDNNRHEVFLDTVLSQ